MTPREERARSLLEPYQIDGSWKVWRDDAVRAMLAFADQPSDHPANADLIARIDAELEGLTYPSERGQLLLDCRAVLAGAAGDGGGK